MILHEKKKIFFIKTCYTLMCLGFALYMGYKQTRAYLANLDTTAVSYRLFHEDGKKDFQPTFSLCLEALPIEGKYQVGKYPGIFKDQNFLGSSTLLVPSKKKLIKVNTSGELYFSWLRGGPPWTRYDNVTKFSQKYPFLTTDFDNVTLPITDFLREMWEMEYSDSNSNKIWLFRGWDHVKKGKIKTNRAATLPPSFYHSYQDPRTLCFTKRAKYNCTERNEKGNCPIKSRQLVGIKTDKLIEMAQDCKAPMKTSKSSMVKARTDKCLMQFQVSYYVHNEGNREAYLQKPVLRLSLDTIWKSFKERYKKDNSTKVIMITIDNVEVLRKRADSNRKCNVTLDDGELSLSMIEARSTAEKVGCVPTYWEKILFPSNATKLGNYLPKCNNSMQYTEIRKSAHDFHRSKYYFTEQTRYVPPCDDMSYRYHVKDYFEIDKFPLRKLNKGPGYINIILEYGTRNYKLIENLRDFGIEDLWSQIGGFIGIFLGYSLLQVPELLWNELRSL